MALSSGTKLGPYEIQSPLTNPRQIVATSEQMFYDVSKDGQRFLINTQIPQAETQPMSIVLNWPAKLTN